MKLTNLFKQTIPHQITGRQYEFRISKYKETGLLVKPEDYILMGLFDSSSASDLATYCLTFDPNDLYLIDREIIYKIIDWIKDGYTVCLDAAMINIDEDSVYTHLTNIGSIGLNKYFRV